MKLYEIHISESINKVLLEHSHADSFMCCLWLQWKLNTHNRDHMAKPKLFTIWPFPEKCLPIPDLKYDTISYLWFYLDPRRFCFPCINHFWLWCIGCSNPTRRSNQSILKEINPEYSLEGAEAPIFWPPDAKSQLIGKDPDSGKDWGQEENGVTEDEMVG